MEKLDSNQLQNVFKDVRNAYRVLALYQRRILDTVKYIGNQYGFQFQSGWSKFSKAASHGNKASINNRWSWDWLTFYLYEFNMGSLIIKEGTYSFKVVHQADTGFFDASEASKISKLQIDEFKDSNLSETRLFFVFSKDANGCPMHHILNGNLSSKYKSKIIKGNWLAVSYDIKRFANQESTDIVIKEFNDECKSTFGINLIEN